MRLCTLPNCGRKHYEMGLCPLHYGRLNRTATTAPRPVTGAYAGGVTINGQREWRHRQIAARALGKPLPKKAHVHHWDGNGSNNRNGNLVMASEDFSYMLDRRPGAYIQIGNGDGGGCEVHNPGYDFNDAALPLGASLFARLAERKLARS